MAPIKPLGVEQPKVTSATPPPGSQKEGVTGFYQEYNTDPPPTNDLNPDVTTPTPETPAPKPVEPGARDERKDEKHPDHPAPR